MSANPQHHAVLSVVVPCFNELAVIRELHRRVTVACRNVVGSNYELILVNDGSVDGTWATLKMLAECDDRVVAVDLSRNHGHQLALSAGLSLARGQRILVIDADLQDPPELLPEMIRLMDDGADVVYGQRVERDGETWFKNLSARAFYRLLLRLTDVPIPPDTGDFRLMSRQVLDALLAMPEHSGLSAAWWPGSAFAKLLSNIAVISASPGRPSIHLVEWRPLRSMLLPVFLYSSSHKSLYCLYFRKRRVVAYHICTVFLVISRNNPGMGQHIHRNADLRFNTTLFSCDNRRISWSCLYAEQAETAFHHSRDRVRSTRDSATFHQGSGNGT